MFAICELVENNYICMRVRVVKKQSMLDFVAKHPNSGPAFASWTEQVKYADWAMPGDILKTFGSADILGNGSNRIIFNIAGNNYRLICSSRFGQKDVTLFIAWIGTHAEYSKLCRAGNQYTINNY